MPEESMAPADKSFSQLFDYYFLRLETNNGRRWSKKELGGILVYNAHSIGDWLNGTRLPPEDIIDSILDHLFGSPPAYAKERAELKNAFLAARNAKSAPPRLRKNMLATNIQFGKPVHFMDEEDAIAAIVWGLNYPSGAVAIAALHGLKGVGKSTLAATFAVDRCADFRATWWINAQTELQIRRDLVELGVRLNWIKGSGAKEDAVANVLRELSANGDKILLIFDNAIDPAGIKNYLPVHGKSQILITSNNHAWGAVARKIEIKAWSEGTGADFLLRRTGRPPDRRHEAVALSEALGGLPLAHEQAGAYCEQRGTSFSDYLKRFKATPVKMLDEPYSPADYYNGLTVAKTFTLGIEEAAKLHPSAESIIMHAALLAPVAIPQFIFVTGQQAFKEVAVVMLSEEEFEQAVAALRIFALIDRQVITDIRQPSQSFDAVRLHRLVRIVAAARWENDAARNSAVGRLIAAIELVYPSADKIYDEHSTWPRARSLDDLALGLVGPEDQSVPIESAEQASSLMARLASYHQRASSNRYKVLAMWNRSIALCKLIFDDRDNITAVLHNNIAIHLEDNIRDVNAAFFNYERALLLRENMQGPLHHSTGVVLGNIARLLHMEGRYEIAMNCYSRALSIAEIIDDRGIFKAMILLKFSFLMRDVDETQTAEKYLLEAYDIFKIESPRSLDMATLLSALGRFHTSQANPDKALELHNEEISIYREIYGSHNPTVVWVYLNIVEIMRIKKNYAAGIILCRCAIEYFETYDAPSRALGCSLNALGLIYLDTGKTGLARETFEKGLTAFKESVGGADPDFAQNLLNLARATENKFETLKIFRKALRIRKKIYGAASRYTAETLSEIASIYDDLGNISRGTKYHTLAVALASKALGEHHSIVKNARKFLSNRSGLSGKKDMFWSLSLRINKNGW